MSVQYSRDNPFSRNNLLSGSSVSSSGRMDILGSNIGAPRQYHHNNLNIWNFRDSRISSNVSLRSSRNLHSELTNFEKAILLGRKEESTSRVPENKI